MVGCGRKKVQSFLRAFVMWESGQQKQPLCETVIQEKGLWLLLGPPGGHLITSHQMLHLLSLCFPVAATPLKATVP